MKFLIAKLNDPKTLHGKFGFVRSPGSQSAIAEDTQSQVTYEPDSLYPVLSVCETVEGGLKMIPDFAPELPVIDPDEDELADEAVALIQEPAPAIRKAEQCSECQGPRRGRGYTHASGCKLDSRVILATKTNHSDGPTCPECGGVKRGRGFSHSNGCKLDSRVILAAKQPKNLVESCPECGGGRRGRGYAHNADCSLSCRAN